MTKYAYLEREPTAPPDWTQAANEELLTSLAGATLGQLTEALHILSSCGPFLIRLKLARFRRKTEQQLRVTQYAVHLMDHYQSCALADETEAFVEELFNQ